MATYEESISIEGQVVFNITINDATSYSIDYGDGNTESDITVSNPNFIVNHNYSKNGDFTVTINANNTNKKYTTKKLTIQVTKLPGMSYDVAYFGYSSYKHIVSESMSTRIYNVSTRIVEGSVLHTANYANDDDVLSISFPISNNAFVYETSLVNPTICNIHYIDANTYQVGVSMYGTPPQGRSRIEITEQGAGFIKGTFSGDVWTNMVKINGNDTWANINNGKFYIKF